MQFESVRKVQDRLSYMEKLVVRRADLIDLEVLLRFEHAIIEAERTYDPEIRTGGNVRYYDLRKLIDSPASEVVVAVVGQEIVGCGYARIEASEPHFRHPEHSYLGFMYVVPEYRGKGVNKRILDALEKWTKAQGVTEMKLEVYLGNNSAIRAYEKSGYTSNLIEMRKTLNEE